jgi:transposase InsO family protein
VRGAGHRIVGHRRSQITRRIDGKKRQLTGFEYLHVIVDDYSRLAYAEVLDDLTAACAIAFLRRAIAWYAARGVTIRSLMTDNGSCYIAHAYSDALRALGLKHLRIKPGRPRTNGKAERLIQTLLNEWILRAHLRQLSRTNRSTRALPRPLQPPTTPRQPQPPTTRITAEQPHWELHLAAHASRGYLRPGTVFDTRARA